MRQNLESIFSARFQDQFFKVLVYQAGHEDVAKVVDEYQGKFDIVVRVPGLGRSIIQNISFNRYLAMNSGFNIFGCDSVLNLEEDVIISVDALAFVLECWSKYKHHKRFRGVNLGSLESGNSIEAHGYSRIRFGVHGPAFMITKDAWLKSDLDHLRDLGFTSLYDGYLESMIKTGFMATPNLSRFLDLGIAGTHTPTSASDPYFRKMKDSFDRDSNVEKFCEIEVAHSWRRDAQIFRKRSNIYYDLLNLARYFQKYSRFSDMITKALRFMRTIQARIKS